MRLTRYPLARLVRVAVNDSCGLTPLSLQFSISVALKTVVASLVGAGQKGILTVQRERPGRTFKSVVVESGQSRRLPAPVKTSLNHTSAGIIICVIRHQHP
jgi:hypothetical protein